MPDNRVKQVIDAGLTGLHVNAQQVYQQATANQEKRPVKWKKSLVFIAALLLMLLAATAIAIGFGWSQAPFFMKKQTSHGSFVQWAAQEQVHVLNSLVEEDFIKETEEVRSFREDARSGEEQGAMAKRIIAQWLSAPEEHISFQTIMENIWGDFRAWSVEQKVWLTNIRVEAGVQTGDMERYVLPAEGAIPQDAAIRLARATASLLTGVPYAELEKGEAYASHVIFPKPVKENGVTSYTTRDVPPVWLVELYGIQDDATQSMLYIEVNPVSGEVHWSSIILSLRAKVYGYKDWPEAALQTEAFIEEQEFLPLTDWPHDARADWSHTIRPLVLQAKENGQADRISLAYSAHVYGVPDVNATKQEEALRIAREALINENMVKQDKLALYDNVYALYDITGPAPIWRIQFSAHGKAADTLTRQQPQNLVHYRVELDAFSGAVLGMEALTLGDAPDLDTLVKRF